MMAKYDCKLCANAATLTCRFCRYRRSPDGEISKPSFYVRTKRLCEVLEEDLTDEKDVLGIDEGDDLAIKILAYIACKTPIPIRLVHEYNIWTDDEEEGGGNAQKEEVPR